MSMHTDPYHQYHRGEFTWNWEAAVFTLYLFFYISFSLSVWMGLCVCEIREKNFYATKEIFFNVTVTRGATPRVPI